MPINVRYRLSDPHREVDMVYLPRLADGELSSRLASSGAVLIEGPKACGKTETARRQAASEVRLDADPRQRAAAEVTPGLILDQPPPSHR